MGILPAAISISFFQQLMLDEIRSNALGNFGDLLKSG
jgi:hypothetical protein